MEGRLLESNFCSIHEQNGDTQQGKNKFKFSFESRPPSLFSQFLPLSQRKCHKYDMCHLRGPAGQGPGPSHLLRGPGGWGLGPGRSGSIGHRDVYPMAGIRGPVTEARLPVSSSLSLISLISLPGPLVPSFGARWTPFKFTVRRHKFNENFLLLVLCCFDALY